VGKETDTSILVEGLSIMMAFNFVNFFLVTSLTIQNVVGLASSVNTKAKGSIADNNVRWTNTIVSKVDGVDIKCPDFDDFFNLVQAVSPLAKAAIQRTPYLGFDAADESDVDLSWKTIEHHPQSLALNAPGCSHIQKIDNFEGKGCPIVRFRASMKGPCVGERFAQMIMDLDTRKKWDIQIANVSEIYPCHDLDAANIKIGSDKYGDSIRLGVGYCRTKSNVVVSPREQLTLCGIQDFPNQACVIWGIEMEENQNHLLPGEDRTVRARTHLFSTTVLPTGPDSFDVEYVLQLDIGGKIPAFMTTPVVCETVKSLFRYARGYFASGEVEKYLTARDAIDDVFKNRKGLLFAP